MRIRRVHAVVAGALLALAGCEAKKPTRPKSAMELCEKLRAHFDDTAGCAPVTEPAQLSMLRAIEAARVQRRVPSPGTPEGERLKDIAWVAYTDEPGKMDLGAALQLMGRQLSGLVLLEESNEAASVSLYVVRGAVSAHGWDEARAAVRRFGPGH